MKKFVALFALPLCVALFTAAFAANISPMYGLNMDNLSDCMMNVSFTLEDVTDKEIFATVYEDTCYDIVDVAQLQVGDTITTGDGDVVIEAITNEDGAVNINGGEYDGGITLYAFDEDNCYKMTYFEYIDKLLRGQAQLTFAEEVTINVYKMNDDLGIAEEGYDTVTLPAAEVAGKLAEIAEKLGDSFSEFNTTALLDKELLVEITVDYMP